MDGKRHPNFLESKDDDEIRIFILGGSTVQGRSLKDKLDPISARLEQKLNERISNKKIFLLLMPELQVLSQPQELSLIQNRIIYSLKPDAIIVLNGTNDAVELPSKNFYLSNSHQFQRNFQKNINNQSKSFFILQMIFYLEIFRPIFYSKRSLKKPLVYICLTRRPENIWRNLKMIC